MTDDIAERIRSVIGDDPNTGEIRMFGGLCFTLNGNMLVGTMKDGGMMARVGVDQEAAALALPGASRMNFTGREMKGFITIEPDGLDEPALRQLIAMATTYVGALPPKQKKSAPKKKQKKA